MKAADIMTTEIVSVGPDTDISEVARLLLAHGVSAAPVIDGDGHILGMVSEGDLMRRAKCDLARSWWLSLFADKTTEFVRTCGTRARDVMTRRVVSINKDATLAEIARILESHRVKRVPVLEGGHLVGIVSRADILRGLASLTSVGEIGPNANDAVIRAQILDLLKKDASVSLPAVSIIVLDGVVYLWGVAETEEQQAAIRIAAETIAGTGKVRDHLNSLSEVLEAAIEPDQHRVSSAARRE